MQMSTISNASFAGGLFKFEMRRNTYYGNHLFTIWRKSWKYATVAFRHSACILFCCSTGKQPHKYIIFHQKNEKQQQTNRVPFIVPMVYWLAFTDCGRHLRDALTSEKNSKRYPCKRTCHITASILRLCVLHKRANISQLQVALQET